MIYTKNVKWCNACRWNFNIRWLKVDSNQKIITHRNIQNRRDVDQSKPFYSSFQMPNEQLFKGIDRLWRMGTVVPCKGIRIQESGIQLKEYEIPPTIEIQNPESRIPVPLTAKTGDQLPGIRNPHCGIKSPRTVLDQTRTQSLLYMRCDLWERFSEFAVHQGKDERKTRSFCHFSSLLPKRVKFLFHIPLRE